jgi:DNA repair exonuclease SbcCD ATPase subunit
MYKNLLIIFIAAFYSVAPDSVVAQSEEGQLAQVQEASSSASQFSRFGLTQQENELDQQIRQEAINFRQAADTGSRERAKEKLEGLLSRDYDERLKGYEDNLNALEKRLQEMRDKLQRRREAKDDMIRLRVKVLEAESEDLGWPERPRRTPRQLHWNPSELKSSGGIF